MSLAPLRSFIEVYRCKSISAASRNLNLTQPAVSGHIMSLETQIGRELFLRQSRGVSPTPFAHDLAQQIGDSLYIAEEALAKAKARSHHLSGVVHIAGPSELLSERITGSLVALQSAGLDVRVQLGGKTSLYSKLTDGIVDLAFTASTPSDPQLAAAAIGSERLLAVAAPVVTHKIAAAKDLAAALLQEPVIAYDKDLPLIRDWLSANELDTSAFSASSIAPDLRLLRSMLVAGAGWSVIPDYLCTQELQRGDLTELCPSCVTPENQLYLVWSKSALRHPRIAFARDVLLRSFEDVDG